MCYNKEVSLVLFIFGVACSIKLFLKGANASGILILCLSLMQFVEFILHLYKNPKSFVHKFASLSIFLVLMIQIAACIGCVYLKDTDQKIKDSITYIGASCLILATFFLFKVLIPNFNNFNSTPKCKSSGCRLEWPTHSFCQSYNLNLSILTSILYTITVLMTLYTIFSLEAMIIVLVLLLLCFIYSMLTTHKSVGTIWCFSVIFAVIFIILFDDKIMI